MASILTGEIQRQAGRIKEQNEHFKSSSTKIYDLLNKISTEIKSEDSDLANTVTLYANAYSELKDKLTLKYENLANIMEKWAQSTQKNEEKTAVDLNHNTISTNTVSELLNSLNR